MILGETEGFLAGLVTIKLNRVVFEARYSIKFEIRAEDGTFYRIQPPFPVFQHESYVEFRNTEEWASLYMKVTVEQIPEIITKFVEKECNECTRLNSTYKLGWKDK